MMKIFIIKTKKKNNPVVSGQMTLEFVFAVVILIIMMYSLAKILLWTGIDIGNRQRAHQNRLTTGSDPYVQIDPYFYSASPLNATW